MKLLPKWNHTYITLFSKVNVPKSVFDYRSINLCNISYKIIARIMVKRLRNYLKYYFSPYQAAFIPGMWIVENTLLTQETALTISGKIKGK